MTTKYENAVLDDQALIEGLKSINPVWGDLAVRVAGEVWGKPLLDQKTKALITIAIDQMALKQGATYEEIEELIVFASMYTGFNKGATTMGGLNKLRHDRGDI
ncbi:carboxymuconolactone decarboxylase family protein [Microbulbifer sp. JTAC008]|uniref:carboxymuconolactone decarboxylase family protein n=1 Tax=unclassified Microbulbifer TaxID=2619833 RepID=UPI004039A094